MTTLSDRGRISEERYKGKMIYTIEERVIGALNRLWNRNQASFSFKISSTQSSVIEADLPEAKFVRYLLNPEHKGNKGGKLNSSWKSLP